MRPDGLHDGWGIAQTKLRPPDPGEQLLARPRVDGRLGELVERHAFTLLSAPAGWGKTTATAAWWRESEATVRAWFTLDAGDDAVDSLFAGVAAALEEVSLSPQALVAALRTVRTPAAEWRRYAAALANDLAGVQCRVVLVLDDLHTVTDPSTLDAVAALIDLLPAEARIVATARYDPGLPLAKLRVRGRLGELRTDVLRFDYDEVERFLNDLHHCEIPAESVRRLTEGTDGWAAAVVLTCSSLERLASRTDREAAIGTVIHTRDLYAFLSSEVLDAQPAALRRFLLETSILDVVEPVSAAVVSGDEDAAEMLEALVAANLAVRLDADWSQPAYRYQDLFAEFLRAELARSCSQEHLTELHRRAAGVAGTDDAAIGHLVSAGLFDEAADRIEAVGRACRAPTLVRLPASVCDALPDDVLRTRPYIRMLRAAVDVRQGRMAEAHAELAVVVEELRAQDDPGTAAALGVFCEAAAAVGDWAGAGAAVTELLEMPIPPDTRVLALVNKLWFGYYAGDADGVLGDIAEVIRVDPQDPQICEAWLLALDCKLLGTPIGVEVLEAHCETLLRRCGDSDVAFAAAAGLRAGIALLRGDITAALGRVRQGREASERAGGLGWLEHEFDLVEMLAALATSRHEEVERIAGPRLEREDPVSLLHLPQNALGLARSRWIRGDRPGLADIHRLLLNEEPGGDGIEMVLARAGVSHFLERAAGEDREAAARLEATLRDVPAAEMFAVSHGRLELDLASALLAAGDEGAALRRAGQSLVELAARDLPGIVAAHGASVVPLLRAALDAGIERRFVETVLAVMAARPAEVFTAPSTGKQLSRRELEVLRLVAGGASNRDVADALFISERTVKSHMTAILRKLGVRSRTQAAHEARRLGLA